MAQGQGGMPQMTPEQQQLMMQVQQTQQALQQTQQKLQVLQQKVYQDNPELEKQKQSLQDAVSKKMSSGGYDADKELEQLQSIANQYSDGKQKPTQEVIQDFQKRQQAFQMREQQALQDPSIQAKAKTLQESLKAKIEASGSEGKALLADLQKQIEQLEVLRVKANALLKN
ncbi:MAG: hypothetical protein ACP5D0_04610 [Hydrogenovibrio sp.]